MSNTDTSPEKDMSGNVRAQLPATRNVPSMPAVVTLIILTLFAFVIVYQDIHDGKIAEALIQTLVSIVMLAVGFWLGSSSDSHKKTDFLMASAPKTDAQKGETP